MVFLHMNKEQREAARHGPLRVEVEVEIAKNRNGRTGHGLLLFERLHTRFRDKLPDR